MNNKIDAMDNAAQSNTDTDNTLIDYQKTIYKLEHDLFNSNNEVISLRGQINSILSRKIVKLSLKIVEVVSNAFKKNIIVSEEDLYKKFLQKEAIPQSYQSLKNNPLISIIVPIYKVDVALLDQLFISVINQSYSNWELILIDDASDDEKIADCLEKYSKKDSRIKYKVLKTNSHISLSSNAGVLMSTGEYIGFLDHDDEIHKEALMEVAKIINKHPETDYIYSDEDKIEIDRTRSYPYFKPDWSRDKLNSFMYSGHFSVYKREIIVKAGLFREGYEGAQDYDLLLRSTEHINNAVHIPKILYHWRKIPTSTSMDLNAKPYAMLAGQRALSDSIKSQLNPDVDYEVKYEGKGFFDVLIDPAKNLKISLFYNSRLTPQSVLNIKKVFKFDEVKKFDDIDELNKVAQMSQSDSALIINSNGRILNPYLLKNFLGYLQIKGVGIIGPKILDINGRIASAGIIIKNGSIERIHKGSFNSVGFLNDLQCLSNYSAIDNCFFGVNLKYLKENPLRPDYKNLYLIDFSKTLWGKNIRTVLYPLIEYVVEENIENNFVTQEETFLKNIGLDPFLNPNFDISEGEYRIKL